LLVAGHRFQVAVHWLLIALVGFQAFCSVDQFVQITRSQMPVASDEMPGPGFWSLVTGSWLLVAGPWFLVASRWLLVIYRFQVSANGLRMHGAWGIAHGVDNLICNSDLKLLRFALCALLSALNQRPEASDQVPDARGQKQVTRCRIPVSGCIDLDQAE
jgi:hypothetical protein